MRSRSAPAVLAFLFLAPPALAQDAAPAASGSGDEARRTLAATRYTGEAPKLDGVLDDDAWSQAPAATAFVQRRPDPGAPSAFATEARVLYDDGAVWVAMRMHDPHPDSIAAPVGRRDLTGISSEWAHVFLDSYNDKRTAFRFSVNPAGVQKDVFHSNDGDEDLGWDAVWESATRTDSRGWTVEMRIPLSQLRFSASGEGEAQVWGVQFSREVARRTEVADWDPIRPDRAGFISQFGELTGVRDLKPARRLEVLPYSVARVTRAPEPDEPGPFWRANDAFGSVGADLKYGITSNLTLTATLNPDFGQVEADPSEVNLTAFESFFEERRPFFTEGSDIFRFNVSFPYTVRGGRFGSDQPFYSRRLGRTPQADAPDGAEFVDGAANTTILGAAKVSGKTAGGWSVGVLDALTAEERIRWADGAGAEDEAVVEPMTNYLVARVLKDFRAGTSALGAIATATHRGVDGDDPRLAFLPGASYLAGVDGRHRFGGGRYELRGAVLGSHVTGGEEAILGLQTRAGHYFQRPGANHLGVDEDATTLSGWLADVKVEKVGGGGDRGGTWRGGLYGHARSPGLEMNDLGFQRTTDWLLQGAWIGWNRFRPQGPFREWNANFNAWNGYSFGGERLTTGINLNGFFGFKNNWGAWWGTDNELEALRADVLRGGPAFTGPAYSSFNAGFHTDNRRVVSGEMFGGGHREWETVGGGWFWGAYVNVRPSGRLRLALGPNVSASRDPWSFVANPVDSLGTRHYVFADIRQHTVSLTTRASYAFTPTLTAELYAQPFVATGAYDDYWEVSDPRAARFEDRFRRYGDELSLVDGQWHVQVAPGGASEYDFSKPDFNFKELRSNLVVRWEYRPGSTMFVVWSQGRQNFDDPGSFRPGRDFRRLFDGAASPSTNVLLVKVNWWLSL
ncbi:MAG TPA: DUF5916 domain-containing protein [Longimicrobium sp.]|nr:DUF5916 domain-containing protein [Longimicrobium sp.]